MNFSGHQHNFGLVSSLAHEIPLKFSDSEGNPFDMTLCSLSGFVCTPEQTEIAFAVEPEIPDLVSVSIPPLPEGRWNYQINITTDNGETSRFLHGIVNVLGGQTLEQTYNSTEPLTERTALVRLPSEDSTPLRVTWLASTVAELSARQALQSKTEANAHATEASVSASEAKGYTQMAETYKTEANKARLGSQSSANLASEKAEIATEQAGIATQNAESTTSDAKTVAAHKDKVESLKTQTESIVNEFNESVDSKKVEAVSDIISAKTYAQGVIEQSTTNALGYIERGKTEAVADLTQLVEAASASAVSAEASAASAGESATMAQKAQSETEALASELDEKFERAVFADNSGNVDISGGLTVSGVANLNGGAVVPETPLWDGAVSNEQVFNYLIDRAERMSPFVTSFPSYIALNSGTLITGESSNSSFSYQGADGSFFFNGSGMAAEAEKLAVFQYPIQLVQATSFYYTKTAFLFVGNPLLNISYLTSEGALAEIVLKNNTSENLFGIRLETKGGKRVATLFCQSTVEEGEISVSSEFVTNGNAYGGSITPEEKWNVLTYVWGGSSSTSAFLRWGNLVMQMPFAMHLINRIQFRTKMGSTKVVMYGGGLACRLATIKTVRLSDATQYMGVKPNSAYLEITE